MFIESSMQRKFGKSREVGPSSTIPAMKRFFLLLIIFGLPFSCLAQQSVPADKYDVATTWPGIHFQISHIERIAGNRLLVIATVYAKPEAPPDGTLIGIAVPIPKNPSPELMAAGVFQPKPFSIESATMMEETTKQTYSTVKPDPAGPDYIAGHILSTIHPHEKRIMAIEFPVPPPPSDGSDPAKQTISILLPNAVGPIKQIILPSPAASAATP
jgi:hypothetical protein